MSRPTYFAANWKMHLGPHEARTYLERFFQLDKPLPGRTLAFFPPAVSLEATAQACNQHERVLTGAQDIYFEPKGAFTGKTSVALARAAGAGAALIGHSEQRHLFGETDADTARKVKAVLDGGLQAVLCVGETLDEREQGQTSAVVARQLHSALGEVSSSADLIIAYEPVWAIGTGRTASPEDAATVHRTIREVLDGLGLPRTTRVLYGGSVNQGNVGSLLSEPDIDGVLVGGASLDPETWANICATRRT